MSTAIASALRALDQFPVSYQTTATDTIIEGDTVEQVFAAVQAAHEAIPDDRVITSIEIDEDRRRPQRMGERVASVERQLGRPAQRRQPSRQAPPQGQMGQQAPQRGQQPMRQPPSQSGQMSPPVQNQQPGQPTHPSR